MLEVLQNISLDAWSILCDMAPYLLFGFAVAGVLSVVLSPETVERHLGGGGLWPVLKATFFGIPLPLCSCGVIPVAASLRRHGATRGATTAFLISTPQTGVDSIMITLGLLGPVFAIFRPLAAFVNGVLGGMVVDVMDKDDTTAGVAPPSCQDTCCDTGDDSSRIVSALRYAFITLPRDIARPLLLGLVIVGLISALVPDDFFAQRMGTGIGAMLVMMLLGLPMYVCATASVPIAAALILKGVTPGAAFVFLMTGPVTNAAAITTIWKIMGKRTAFIYLATVAVSALGAGILLDLLIVNAGTGAVGRMGWMLPEGLKTALAVMLLLILGYGLIPQKKQDAPVTETQTTASRITLTVIGMTCSHCENSVRRTLLESDGVRTADVDLQAGEATVSGEDLDADVLIAAIESLGFDASN
jgi:uncharacterized membrane protein YraQ (UPF0718 family)/copper chaperone CopZ